MDTNIYLELVSNEILDLGKWTDGMIVRCHQHGDLKYYNYDAYIPWNDISSLAEEHLTVMHSQEK